MAFKVIHLSVVFKFGHTFCSNYLPKKKEKKKRKETPKINIKAGNGKADGQLCLENRLLNLSRVCVLFMQLYVNICSDKAFSPDFKPRTTVDFHGN